MDGFLPRPTNPWHMTPPRMSQTKKGGKGIRLCLWQIIHVCRFSRSYHPLLRRHPFRPHPEGKTSFCFCHLYPFVFAIYFPLFLPFSISLCKPTSIHAF